MPNVNTYVPDDKYERAKEKDLNFSKILQAGIDRELIKLDAKEATMLAMDAAVERLRISMEEETEEEYQEGYGLGSRWALEKASYSGLKWFAAQADRKSGDVTLGEDLLIFLANHYGPNEYGDPNGFMEELYYAGAEHRPPYMHKDRDMPFYAGLLDGAADVWKQVLPKITK